MSTQDAKASGDFQVFYSTEILRLKAKLEGDNYDGMSDPFLVDEDIQTIAKAAWDAGREYGKREVIKA